MKVKYCVVIVAEKHPVSAWIFLPDCSSVEFDCFKDITLFPCILEMGHIKLIPYALVVCPQISMVVRNLICPNGVSACAARESIIGRMPLAVQAVEVGSLEIRV